MKKPIITIKNVKYAAFASHETPCFECSVYVDGKRFATAHNGGQGGDTDITPLEPYTWNDLSDLQERIMSTYEKLTFSTSEGDALDFCGEMDLETLLMECLDKHLATQDFKKMLRNLVYKPKGEKCLYSLKLKATPQNILRFKNTERFKDAILLNDISPKAARSLYDQYS